MHLDEAVIPINGTKHWLWPPVDANGEVLDILVQVRRYRLTATSYRYARSDAFDLRADHAARMAP